MTNTEYNKLLKYLYFEGYADSYEEADYILEDMSNIERKQLLMESGIYEGASQDVANRAARLARKKGQTPERQKMYQNLAANARQREDPLGPLSRLHRATELGAVITPKSSAAARESDANHDWDDLPDPNKHGRHSGGAGSRPKNPETYRRQVLTGVRAASSQEKKRLGVKENYEILLDYLIDEGYTNTVDGAVTIIENMSDGWMESIINEAKKSLPISRMKQKEQHLKNVLKTRPSGVNLSKIMNRLNDIENVRRNVSTRGGKADPSATHF